MRGSIITVLFQPSFFLIYYHWFFSSNLFGNRLIQSALSIFTNGWPSIFVRWSLCNLNKRLLFLSSFRLISLNLPLIIHTIQRRNRQRLIRIFQGASQSFSLFFSQTERYKNKYIHIHTRLFTFILSTSFAYIHHIAHNRNNFSKNAAEKITGLHCRERGRGRKTANRKHWGDR